MGSKQKKMEKCNTCGGSGQLDRVVGNDTVTSPLCYRCHGTGKVAQRR